MENAFTVAETIKNASAMAQAAIGMARVTGNIIDRREVGDVGAFSGHTDEELMHIASERAARLGLCGRLALACLLLWLAQNKRWPFDRGPQA